MVIKEKCEHTVKVFHKIEAIFGVRLQNDLGVRSRLEAMAESDQRLPQLDIIVNLAVENDGQRTAGHRLPAGNQVDDGQSLVVKGHVFVDVMPFVVRAAVADFIRHPFQQGQLDSRLVFLVDDSDKSAHGKR